MTYFTHIRAGLISSILLLTTALVSPAFAETLPEISPRQIASDVEVKYNPQTGAKVYIAPSFDPFEEDRSMAGTASLRSVSSATTIDGQSIRGGALLDMTFYYNSASNDPYDTRGYDDAVYLSGEYAPVIRRDNRILECNEQVQDVVYYHEDYYRPSIYVNLFRPYRHYSGHHRYDRGYGYGNDRGYRGRRGYGSRRGYGTSSRGRGRNDRGRHGTRNRRNTTDQIIDRTVDRARRTVTAREERAATGRRMDRTPSAREANRAPRAERAAPAPRPERIAPARTAQRVKSRNAPKRNYGGKGGKRGSKLKMMGFLPMASSWSRNAVRNVDVQCAREEMLTVHIPQERLDAARFDGLTVLVLDRTGQEIPVYVPANYIEGFRQAIDGRVAPNTSYQEPRTSAPVTRGPVYQQPRPTVESAPCPVGTTKQDDGTCLQGGTVTYGGYPTR